MLNTKPAAQLGFANSAHTHDSNLLAVEQQKILQNFLPLLHLANVVSGTFLIVIIAVATGLGQWGLYWFAVLIGGTVVRAFVRLYLLSVPKIEFNLSRASQFLVIGNLLDGLVWGTAWLLLPQDPSLIEVALIGFWLTGLQAGAVALATMTAARPTFFSYTILANVGYLIFVGSTNIEYQNLTIAAYVMCVSFIIPIAMRIGAELNKTIGLKARNEILSEKIKNQEFSLLKKQSELTTQRKKSIDLELQKDSVVTKSIAASEEKDLLIDSLEEGVFRLNQFGEFTFSNSSARRLLHFDELELLSKSAISVLSSSLEPYASELKTNFRIGGCYLENKTLKKLDSVFCGANGIQLPVRFSCRSVVKDKAVIGAVISFTDMTKRREMEKMLFQSQKMEAIGRLTGGVSHDFNNLLTIIMGNIEFLKRRFPNNTDANELLDRILGAAKRGAELNHRLLNFSGEQSFEETTVDANLVIREMYDFLIRSLGEDVSLTLELCHEACPINVDRAQFESALLNLCVNARDAMPQGGVLRIGTQLNPDLYKYDYKLDKCSDEIVLICVTDSGIGISPESLEHVFEPFYSTKKNDRGTGLGLSTAYGFVKRSGGNIVVESRQWEWTRFKILLPKSTLLESAKEPKIANFNSDEQMSGLVLVVEDDENVRKIAAYMLAESGFDVVAAADGIQGLALFKSTPNIDFVFSDIIMPGGISGIQLAESILEMSPRTPIILVSGYTDKATRRNMPAARNVTCISKPYNINEIPRVVKRMITEAKSYE
jgi:signal transduction histidine kinase/CheY-like chemotaxis protein